VDEEYGLPIALNLHRQFTVAMQRKFLSYPKDDPRRSAAAEAFAHGDKADEMNYARKRGDPKHSINPECPICLWIFKSSCPAILHLFQTVLVCLMECLDLRASLHSSSHQLYLHVQMLLQLHFFWGHPWGMRELALHGNGELPMQVQSNGKAHILHPPSLNQK